MAKLSELRQRMTTVNSALTSLQDRLERLYAVALPGARIGALAAAFNAARTPARQPVLRDEVPLSDPILPLPERVSPLVAPRTPQSAPAPPISSNVVPGTPSTALAKLRKELSASPPPSSLNSFVSSAQHYDAAVSSSPLPPPVLNADPPAPSPVEEPR